MIPRGLPVVVQKPPMLNSAPCPAREIMRDSLSGGWVHKELERQERKAKTPK